MRAGFLCVSVLEKASGPGVGLAGCGGAFPPPPHTPGWFLCWPFWGGGPGVGLVLCCFVVCSAGRFVVCLSVCRFVLVFSVVLVLRLPRLGRRGWGVGGGGVGLVLVLFVRLFDL